MRCVNCFALRCEGYEYPEEYCGAGVPDEKCMDFSDGTYGCKFPAKAIKARLQQSYEAEEKHYMFSAAWFRECEYKGSGIDVRSEKEPFISDAMHCIGMDYKKPYTRHGRKFYKPYRNYFATHSSDKVWSILKTIGYAEEYTTELFRLTDAGFNWLSNCIGVVIKNEIN